MILLKSFIVGICCLCIFSGCAGMKTVSLEEALQISSSKESQVSETESLEKNSILAETGVMTDEKPHELIYVHVCGRVQLPGVYRLEQDSRIVTAIELAGGFLEDAAKEAINLAAPISDGMQIVVPSIVEWEKQKQQKTEKQSGKVILNNATLEELCTLSGIGEAKALAILAYRKELGTFSKVEQLKEVTGIGERLFNQIKESIYIE